MAYLATCGRDLTHKERLFIALAWMPKATVQAALGPLPYDLVLVTMDPEDPTFEQHKEWGMTIVTTAVISIIITAPLGLLTIRCLGDQWLNFDGTGEVTPPS